MDPPRHRLANVLDNVTSSIGLVLQITHFSRSLQVVLRSQLEATVTVTSARLELQSNFFPAQADQSSSSIDTAWLLPLTVHAGSEGALLFTVKPTPATLTASDTVTANGDGTKRLSISVPSKASSVLVLEYTMQGDRRYGAHSTVSGQKPPTPSTFRHSFVLQMPVLEKRLAVGLLPLSGVLTVGRALVLQWRVERLVGGEKRLVNGEGEDGENENAAEELSYEIKAGQEQARVWRSLFSIIPFPVFKTCCQARLHGFLRYKV